MSEIGGGQNTDIGIDFCPGERYLKAGCSRSSILAVDVGFARDLVMNNLIDEPSVEAVVSAAMERVEHAGRLSPCSREELESCLGKIARKECTYYKN